MDYLNINSHNIETHTINTVIVGSGAAGFNAADRLYSYGQTDIAIVTEGLNMGTSRNTGSDKQTYYKLTLADGTPDSVRDMAQTLYDGGCMHGDHALTEAALSVESFYRLVSVGVPFPRNEYGEYVGYKTDHDPRSRATSAGPLTSKYMTECLEAQVKSKNIKIFDGYKVIGIVVGNGVCRGLLALNKSGLASKDTRFTLFNCANVILATGAPAGLYANSVYPKSQVGSSGIAFEAGVKGANLTEWQYGIASIKFRWNLSGTYQQVIPRYISTNTDGGDAREFLQAYFPNVQSMLEAIFLKGYQWPFDPRKIEGSSKVDVAVYNEICNGRRVFLDFITNPSDLAPDFSNIGKEAFDYLNNSNALLPMPIERLAKMNPKAIELYKSNRIDLYGEPLEISVCAQHNNGGLAVNHWWETNIRGLFAVGEAAGTHGVYRPGGSALNAGQVSSARAAEYIAAHPGKPLSMDDFHKAASSLTAQKIALSEQILSNKTGKPPLETRHELGEIMSRYAAHVRTLDSVSKVADYAKSALAVVDTAVISDISELVAMFENVDLLTAQYVYASAMKDYIKQGGGSRGSYLINDSEENRDLADVIQEAEYKDGLCNFNWIPVRPLPDCDYWFENVWNKFISERA